MSNPAIELLTYLQKEWTVVTKSPWIFVFALLIVFFCAYRACKWVYGGIIANLREQNATLKQKPEYKTEGIDASRIYPHFSRTALSQLSNPALVERTMEIVKQIQGLLLNGQLEFQKIVDGHSSEMGAATSDEERQSLLRTCNELLTKLNLDYGSEFEDRFGVDTALCQNELLLRLGIGIGNAGPFSKFQEGKNLNNLERVANHLEKLAKSLPL